MKKSYCKPLIAFESFELTESIADSCAVSAGPSDVRQCAYSTNIAGMTPIFLEGQQLCTTKVTTDGEYGLCYHIPVAKTSLFNS